MRIGQRGWMALAAVLVVAIAGWLAFQRYWYYLPGIIGELRNPIEATHAVTFEQGPATPALPAGRRPPNIVVILADDLGFNDITLNGGGVAGGAVPTPNINSIAHGGVTFANGYAGNATCAPSRAAIMTGRYATRFGFEFTPAPVTMEKMVAGFDYGLHKPIFHAGDEDLVPPYTDQVVPPGEIMIPQLLKSAGYHTLFFGKWHLGETDAARPDRRGFDEALGFLAGGQMYLRPSDPNVENSVQDFDPIDKFIWANLPFAVTNNGSHRFYPSEYMTDYLGDQAVRAIAANRNRPFFIYLAFNAPHTPLQALRSDYDALPAIKDHRLRVYGAMIRALDRNIGHVLAALKANGLEDNTLVVFTSDNGGANYIGLPDINRPYRGWKMTFFEGGIHVPFFMKWPARIPAGVTFAPSVAHVDIYATVAAAAGAPVPADRVLDGVNLLPFVTGTSAGAPHQSLFWRSGNYETILAGGWKLQVSRAAGAAWLFDLGSDPLEHRNLAALNPEKFHELQALLAHVDAQQHKPLWPSLIDGPIDIDHPLSFPQKPGEEFVYWSN